MNHDKIISKLSKLSLLLHSPLVEYVAGASGKKYLIKPMAGGAVRSLEVGDYLLLTQNPNKPGSLWAAHARAGGQVTWLIYKPTNQWLARVVDGVVDRLEWDDLAVERDVEE